MMVSVGEHGPDVLRSDALWERAGQASKDRWTNGGCPQTGEGWEGWGDGAGHGAQLRLIRSRPDSGGRLF